jgi:hypothetical protein
MQSIWYDIFIMNVHKQIPVSSALFMPATQSMEYFMDDNPFTFATIPNRYILLTTNSTNITVAPAVILSL